MLGGVRTFPAWRPAAAIALLLASSPANAALFFCSQTYGPGTPGFNDAYALGVWFCASTETRGEGGFDSSVAVGDTAGQTFPVQASRVRLGGRGLRVLGGGELQCGAGVLRAIATAGASGNGEASSNGDAEASLLDRGPLTPIGGAAPGAAVTFHLTVDVGGAFIGEGGGGDAALKVYRNGSIAHERTITTNVLQSQFSDVFDLPGFVVGDDVALYLRLRAFAGAVDLPDTLSAATADLGDSARLHLDITSGNARFDAASGHDYRLAPEPVAPGLARRRRGGARRGSRMEAAPASPPSPARVTSRLADRPALHRHHRRHPRGRRDRHVPRVPRPDRARRVRRLARRVPQPVEEAARQQEDQELGLGRAPRRPRVRRRGRRGDLPEHGSAVLREGLSRLAAREARAVPALARRHARAQPLARRLLRRGAAAPRRASA